LTGKGIRRVVTGHDGTGKAIVLRDELAPNVRSRALSGTTSTLVWTTAGAPAPYANDDRSLVEIGTAPLPSGTLLRIVEFPAYDAAREALDPAAFAVELGVGHHDHGKRRHPTHPFMHATDSVDYAIVLEGEIDMLLDDSEVHLGTGDVLIQQGTNHAWINRGDRPCRVAFVLIDAEKL
jgi:mannose-6-phosphate isomerase-like protein (cupin superfamily)